MNTLKISNILLLICTITLPTIVQAQDWANVPIPANAGANKKWELQSIPSDDFNYTFEATTERSNFGDDKWYNFYHNSWDGPGTTYWQHDHISVENGNLVLKASRNPKTTKMGVPGINSGCITSNTKVVYPVFVESRVSVANIALASDVWLLSPDDTQEIDIIECYGGADNGNSFFAQYIHLSHHSFIRNPFTDYQPRDRNSWWSRSGVSAWGDYCWNEGDREFVQIGVNWISPFHFEYYIDGELVRVLYDKAFATNINGTWYYNYPSSTNGKLDFAGGYQKVTPYTTSKTYSFQTLKEASDASSTSVIDPYNYQNGNGFTKPMDIIINVESQNWHVEAGRTPTDADLLDPAKNTMLVDWIRVYKPVEDPNSSISVTGITLDQTSTNLKFGESITLQASIAPANADDQSVTWSSTDTSIATVAAGVVTAKSKEGTVTIKATTTDGGFVAECAITVSNPILGLPDPQQETILIVPNPAHRTIHFTQIQSAQIEIFTLTGEKVLSQQYQSGSTIDISGMRNGVYLVKVKAPNQKVQFVKLLVK